MSRGLDTIIFIFIYFMCNNIPLINFDIFL